MNEILDFVDLLSLQTILLNIPLFYVSNTHKLKFLNEYQNIDKKYEKLFTNLEKNFEKLRNSNSDKLSYNFRNFSLESNYRLR